MLRSVLLAVTLLLFAAGCKKTPEAATEYMRCNIDGRPWGATSADDATDYVLTADWDNASHTLTIEQYGNSEAVKIVVTDTAGLKGGDYILFTDSVANSGRYTDYTVRIAGLAYDTNGIDTGAVHVKYDSLTEKITGNFFFNAKSDSGSMLARVTAGAFSTRCKIK